MSWNKTLAVTLDPDGKSGFTSVSVDDILFFRQQNKRIQVHTENGEFYLNGGEVISRLLSTLAASGYYFAKSDREDIPNIMKIRTYSKTWSRVYFCDDPTKKSKCANVTRNRFREFVEFVLTYNGTIKEKTVDLS